jgi:hypothetical protein
VIDEVVDGQGGVEADAAGEVDVVSSWGRRGGRPSEAISGHGGVEADAVSGRGVLEADPMRRRWCRCGGAQSRSGHVSGGEMIVARVKVRAPHR